MRSTGAKVHRDAVNAFAQDRKPGAGVRDMIIANICEYSSSSPFWRLCDSLRWRKIMLEDSIGTLSIRVACGTIDWDCQRRIFKKRSMRLSSGIANESIGRSDLREKMYVDVTRNNSLMLTVLERILVYNSQPFRFVFEQCPQSQRRSAPPTPVAHYHYFERSRF